jgi:hypothetical protein
MLLYLHYNVYIFVHIYQLLLTHGAKVAPSFYKSQKSGEEGQTLITLNTLACSVVDPDDY